MRSAWRTALALLAPPLCAACSAPCDAASPICPHCRRALATAAGGAKELPGLGAVTWAAPYTGVPRDLVTALKFGGRLQLAAVVAQAIAATIEPGPFTVIVPVPAAPARRRARGFDPAALIAAALGERLGLPLAEPLRRRDGPRQVGRRRADRLADPPRVAAVGPVAAQTLLVDDVLTTGATLTACAGALRRAGATGVHAATFARTLGDPNASA